MVYGLWFMVCGLWFVVYGLWFMVCGLWFVVYGLWFMVCGLWFMVSFNAEGAASFGILNAQASCKARQQQQTTNHKPQTPISRQQQQTTNHKPQTPISRQR
ncbi:hypothetical protein [Longitalea arenae]|uniref:hypothetical protein n=1 Tax=Longitalea arenae TaxID=2812558 RepID=UPI001967999C|nr:hypothetical protein [Longitalea arenae]